MFLYFGNERHKRYSTDLRRSVWAPQPISTILLSNDSLNTLIQTNLLKKGVLHQYRPLI